MPAVPDIAGRVGGDDGEGVLPFGQGDPGEGKSVAADGGGTPLMVTVAVGSSRVPATVTIGVFRYWPSTLGSDRRHRRDGVDGELPGQFGGVAGAVGDVQDAVWPPSGRFAEVR